MRQPKYLILLFLLFRLSGASAQNVEEQLDRAFVAFNQGQLNACIEVVDSVATVAEDWESPVLQVGRKARYSNPALATLYFDYFKNRATEKFGHQHSSTAKMYAFKAECFLKQDRLLRSAENFEETISILEEVDGSSNFYKLILQKTGNIYARLGNNAKALEYLEQCFTIAQQTNDKSRSVKVSTDINRIYLNQEDFEQVLAAVDKTLNDPELEERFAITQTLYQCDAAVELGRTEGIETKLLNTLELMENHPELQGDKSYLYSLLGKLSLNQKDLAASEKYYSKSIDLTAPLSRERANMTRQRGGALMQLGVHDRALVDFQNALAFYSGDSSIIGNLDNPPAHSLSPEPQVVLLLLPKGQALEAQGMDSAANATYRLAFHAANLTQRVYLHENSKLDMGEHTYRICQQAVELNYLRMVNSKDAQSAADLFFAIEANKGNALKAFRQQAAALEAIPEKFLRQQQLINEDILDLEASQQHSPTDTVARRIFELRRSLDTLHLFLQKKYQSYSSAVGSSPQMELEDVRNRLDDRSCFLTYFAGSAHYYALAIWGDEVLTYRFPLALLDSLEPAKSFLYSSGQQLAQVKATSRQLYDLCIGPLVEKLPSQIERLIVSPDGDLHRIPFAALTDPNHQLLLKRFSIGYAVSASNQFEDTNSKQRAAAVLAMAPFPTTAPVGLAPLVFTEQEIGGIKKIAALSLLGGKDATSKSLKSRAADFPIIHFATHADVDLEDPLQSGLWLIDESNGTAQKFTVPEIYNLRNQAQLVVLSACNTGVGPIRSGEGVLSLARAFNRAGAKSTLLSLWAVDDQSTAVLMEHFYKGLSNGLPKDEALRQAQLTYLSSADPLHTHPWFWSGFILSGDTSAVKFRPGNSWGTYGLIGLLLLLPGLFFLNRRRYSAKKVH